MVHALQEIHRVLKPDGILIDLRPLADRWPIEVTSLSKTEEAVRVSDLPEGLEQDRSADRAIQEGVAQNWYRIKSSEHFPFFYYWDSPKEMQDYIQEEWEDFARIEEQKWSTIRSMWAVANADARLRIRVKMLITRLQKIG